MTETLRDLASEITSCTRCPRLVEWREGCAADPPRRYRGERYWARPLPGFGDPRARIAVVGLAPAAHGGNRTGRMFTGDRSGDWLYAALHRAGSPTSRPRCAATTACGCSGAYVTAVVRCAPPDNRPTPEERDNCLPYLVRELRAARSGCRRDRRARRLRLGRHAAGAGELGAEVPRPRPRFGARRGGRMGPVGALLGCFHPSQQNTFTGRLTEPMLDVVFARAKDLAHP